MMTWSPFCLLPARPMDEITAPASALPPLVRLRAHLRALDPLRLPPYAGSTWRGLLGHGLRQAACVTRARTCDGCLLASHCVYPRVFEPLAPPGEASRRYAAPPDPMSWTLISRRPGTMPPTHPSPLA